MLNDYENISFKDMQRINMRNVDHLLAVEFIHNLYNRHLPRINSVRFRNTTTYWINGKVNSYAPKSEWQVLNSWVSKKFITKDKRFIEQINLMLNRDMSFLYEYLSYLSELNLKYLSPTEIGMELMNLMDFTLGEIYQLNVVQLEYPLTNALDQILKLYIKDDTIKSRTLSQIITTDLLTESQKEQIEFNKIVQKGIMRNCVDPQTDKSIYTLIQEHILNYSHMHCAYGEAPYDESFYLNKYKKEFKNGGIYEDVILNEVRENYLEGQKILRKLKDERLQILVPLMARLGVFRDRNKALLGKTVKYRYALLDQIAILTGEERENLNYYLMHEILTLLEQQRKLEKKKINARKLYGIKLVRNEYLELADTDHIIQEEKNQSRTLEGICASEGKVNGICKVIVTKKDSMKIAKGDIMVAVGTDFDLLEAMHLSAGVITEEGGLLSHASVVCREINKPCLIGVKNATLKLKDGMRVELDATNSIIRIL